MQQRGNVWVIIVSLVAVIAIAGAAFLYGQNQSLRKETSGTNATDKAAMPEATVSALTSSSPASSPAGKATVVFEAEGSFTQSEKDELKAKIINPFLDYYLTESSQVLLTLTISKNDKASKDQYPYEGQAVFQGGGNMGFLIMKVGTGVDWWYPECLNGCNLTLGYKTKYPEIAAKVQ